MHSSSLFWKVESESRIQVLATGFGELIPIEVRLCHSLVLCTAKDAIIYQVDSHASLHIICDTMKAY